MRGICWNDLAQATAGRLEGPAEAPVAGVSTDTRTLQAGEAYLALRGPRFDGHVFLSDAVARGACGWILEEGYADRAISSGLPPNRLYVPDTLTALGDIARAWALRCPAKRIGVTGSVGKTGTRRMLAAILKTIARVCESLHNHNNLVGCPQTLLRLTPDDRYLVAELGADRPGEIERLTEILQPQLGIITAIAPAHLERFGSVEAVAREKARLIEGLVGDNPVAVIPAEGPCAGLLRERARGRVVTFGLSSNADVRADDIRLDENGLAQFALRTGRDEMVCYLNVPGRAAVLNALAAAAAALALGLGLERIVDGLESYGGMEGRGRLIRLVRRGALLLDSAYNASPASVSAALETLAALAATRRIAVLGDMLELGAESEHYHCHVGEEAARHRVDVLVCVGTLSAVTAQAASTSGVPVVHSVDGADAAFDVVNSLIREGDAILVKGSHAIGLERLVQRLSEEEGARR